MRSEATEYVHDSLLLLCTVLVEFFQRLAEELGIEVQADFVHGAGLLAAEDIARPADFKVFQRNLESGAKALGLAERF